MSDSNLTLGSLFSGSGGFELAGLLSGIQPKWASEIEPYPIAVTRARFPDMKHYGDVTRINGAKVEPVDIITFGSPCFPAGVKILTDDGVKNIEDIRVGDKVLTHMGRWNKVTAFGYKEAETVILHGDTVDLECTPNHPIYSLDIDTCLMNSCGEVSWVEAKDMACRLYAVPTSIGVTCSYEPIKADFLHYWYYIRSVEWTRQVKTVYNLTVEEDNSYVADGVVVHNCQDMSVAGKRAGITGERSGLFFQAIRIIKEMREATNGIYPTFAVWENVFGSTSSNGGQDFREVLNAFVRVVEPEAPSVPMPEKGWPYADILMGDGFSIAYRTLDAQYWGVAQRRKRIYLVADFTGQRAGKILFESEGLSRYSPQSFSAWQDFANGIGGSSDRPGKRERVTFRDHTDCLYAAYGTKWNGNAAAYNGSLFVGEQKPVCLNDQGGRVMEVSEDVVGTLRAEMHGHEPCVIDNKKKELYDNHRQRADYGGPLDVAPTITAMYGTGGVNTPFVVNDKSEAYGIGAFQSEGMKSENPKSGFYKADKSRTLDGQGGNPACNQGGIAIVEERKAIPFSQNQRNEVRDLGEKAGAVMAEPGMKQQTYICEPTYTLTDGPHSTLGKGKTPCLAARDYKSPDVVAYQKKIPQDKELYENHGQDGRYNGPLKVAPTVQAGYGEGGLNKPIVKEPTYSLQGSMIGREEKNGPQGNGVNKDVCFTLNTIDRHAVSYGVGRESKMAVNEEVQPSMTARGVGFVGITNDDDDNKKKTTCIAKVNDGRQGERVYSDNGPSQTLSANSGGVGGKTGLYLTQTIVRRLTPTECARLQGFPDSWTDDIDIQEPTEEDIAFWREIFELNGKKKSDSQIRKWLAKPYSDSATYKMWGNGIALPCAAFVLAGIEYYAREENNI